MEEHFLRTHEALNSTAVPQNKKERKRRREGGGTGGGRERGNKSLKRRRRGMTAKGRRSSSCHPVLGSVSAISNQRHRFSPRLII